MARDDRKIVSAIRMPADRETRKGRRVFKEGDEEELAAAASAEQLQAWADSGAITGTWKGVKAAEEASETLKGGKKGK